MNALDWLEAHGFGVYNIPNGFAVADPLDDEQGYYLEVGSIEEVEREIADRVTVTKPTSSTWAVAGTLRESMTGE